MTLITRYPRCQRIFFSYRYWWFVAKQRQRGAKPYREHYQTVRTAYFILGILRTDLWSQGNNSAASWAVFLIPKMSQIIRHCKFVLQGTCIFLTKRKKTQTTCSFLIGTKNPTKRKFIVEASFFASWTITSEKCTPAHVKYLSRYLSMWKPFWTRVYIYRCE